jgi:hypothetical protein
LTSSLPPEVDHAKSAALALSSPGIAKSQLSEATSLLYDVTRLRILHQLGLQPPKAVVVDVCRAMPLESRQFNENGSH